MKFEATWREGWETYERVFDTILNRSVKRIIDKRAEFFVPSSMGNYRSVLDNNLRLDKRFGTYKQGSSEFGFQGAAQHHIRDSYWNEDNSKSKYNTDIAIWYIDIETRSGVAFEHYYPVNHKVELKKPDGSIEITTAGDVRERFKDLTPRGYQILENGEYSSFSNSRLMKRIGGFPEPDLANEEISMFQILCTKTNTMFLLGTKEWVHMDRYLKYGDNARYAGEHEEIELPFEVRYLNCGDEIKLIEAFLALYERLDPLLLLAWNGCGFDYPYIFNRMKKLGLDTDKLSNYNGCSYREGEFQGRKEFTVKPDGHFWMDLKEIYIKFDFGNHADYTLDTIAYDELKDRKVDHDEYITFDDFYTGNYNKPDNPTEDQKRMLVYKAACESNDSEVRDLGYSEFVWYGLKDTWLLKRIDDKRKFTDAMLMISSMTGTELSDSLGTVRIWSQYLSNLLMKRNLVLPPKEEHPTPQVVGGYVADPVKGKHEWVMSVDVNSMYPLLGMVGSNMSPETYIQPHDVPAELQDYIRMYYNTQDETNILELDTNIKESVSELLRKYNISLGINGACFSQKEVGIVPQTVKDIYLNRKEAQKKLRALQSKQIAVEDAIRKKVIS